MDALVLTLYKKIDSHLDTPWLFVMIKRSHWGLVAVAHIEWQRAGDQTDYTYSSYITNSSHECPGSYSSTTDSRNPKPLGALRALETQGLRRSSKEKSRLTVDRSNSGSNNASTGWRKQRVAKAEAGQSPNCTICKGMLPVGLLNARDDMVFGPSAYVLSCGHMFHDQCLERHFKTASEEGRKLSCKACEAVMECDHCGTKARVLELPKLIENEDDLDDVPMTIPEGGYLPPKCLRCRSSDSWMADRGEQEVIKMLSMVPSRNGKSEPGDVAVRKQLGVFIDAEEKKNKGKMPEINEIREIAERELEVAHEGDWLWGEIFEYDEAWYYAEIWKMTGREGVAAC
ncbi:uncharacterized protein TRIREDRAFT_110763 [Trichoderma reesei QM6a]|uniref:Predicted protein n=1 Tax=Hypocrea jecorina (strain QM6a) TaxID=431241 RepID=G0RSV8_HYPJQ|nr:uncharacterized protein TRIREDRAFT_110763 [Trichoderma reesei QM6a]EGR45752.1 predicted protein [Trichoderma reesei QM6a]